MKTETTEILQTENDPHKTKGKKCSNECEHYGFDGLNDLLCSHAQRECIYERDELGLIKTVGYYGSPTFTCPIAGLPCGKYQMTTSVTIKRIE